MSHSSILNKFTATMHLLDDYRKSALQHWTMSGSGSTRLIALIRQEATSFPHRIELAGRTISVHRCAVPGWPSGTVHSEELSAEMSQETVDSIVLGLVRKSLGQQEAFMLFDQPR